MWACPGISGYELARRATNRNIPVLLCSEHSEALIKLKEHDCPHLAKPFRLDELIYEIAKVITQAQELKRGAVAAPRPDIRR
jgi:CheY-like chemotaxis protein